MIFGTQGTKFNIIKPTYFNIGGVPEHFNIPIRKAIDEGIFSLQNIELNWKDYKGGTGDLVKALDEKQIDIGILLTEGAIKAAAEKKQFKIVQVYVNTPLYWGIHCGIQAKWNSIDEIENPSFCISRYGSGSHLMAYLLCKQRNWDTKAIEFIEVGNFSGALMEFNKNPHRLFLWERFMTKPYVDSQTLKKLGEIPTPWASFSIVVRNDVLDEYKDTLLTILQIISNYTYKFKQHTLESIDYISNYFDFSIQDMKEWIISTDWNYVIDKPQYKMGKALEFLKTMNLIPIETQCEDVCPSDTFWENFSF